MTTAQPHDDDVEVDWAWANEDSTWIPPEIDANRPSPARMYDFALGGKDNFAADRAAVRAVGEILPNVSAVALANRGFLIRAVDAMTRQGIDQFIDVGTGIPTSPNVHEVAQLVNPDARVVYVDNDPIVMAHNRALRSRQPGVITLARDLRQPTSITDSPELRAHLDFDRPIGLLFFAVLHFIRRELAVEVVKQFRRSLPAGSYLAISTACSDGMNGSLIARLEAVYARSPAPFVLRSRSQIEHLLDGVDLMEPGLVDVEQWRGEVGEVPLGIRILGGAGRIVDQGR